MTASVTIEECGRTIAATVVAFDVRWAGELPEDGDVVWAVRVTSEDGGSSVELGHRRDRDRVVQYVGDLVTGSVQQVRPDADLDSDGVTVRFPSEIVGAAVEWPTWQAAIFADGRELATCAIRL